MAYFIIIRGPLGCGKTTTSKRLSKVLNAEYISIDKVLEEHDLDNIDPELECIPVENFIKANEIVLPRVKERLKRGNIDLIENRSCRNPQ